MVRKFGQTVLDTEPRCYRCYLDHTLPRHYLRKRGDMGKVCTQRNFIFGGLAFPYKYDCERSVYSHTVWVAQPSGRPTVYSSCVDNHRLEYGRYLAPQPPASAAVCPVFCVGNAGEHPTDGDYAKELTAKRKIVLPLCWSEMLDCVAKRSARHGCSVSV